jgi:serine/threonine protein phosphatase PrpC
MLRAAGKTDPGRQRAVNEDRLHVDEARGLFIVIDGVGGQAAGGKAADVALSSLRTRLEHESGAVVSRIREALTAANNEIFRLAGTRPEWNGMACVATVLVVNGSRAFVGHVGDTRLYKLSQAGMQKVTRDHSPVGEREDAGEISELEAMRHHRRNEVYRDLGSDLHEPGDAEFIDVSEIAFEHDAALLLCSDGLTDLVDSATINEVVRRCAGRPDQVVTALIAAANRAGGKDNVTAIYVEGAAFVAAMRGLAEEAHARRSPGEGGKVGLPAEAFESQGAKAGERYMRFAILFLLTVLFALTVGGLPRSAMIDQGTAAPSATSSGQVVVRAGESISDALRRATAGSEVVVEPGEYREAVSLPSHVRLVSRIPGAAIIRLPAHAGENDAAAIAVGVTGAALVGFRIVGDATTALGTGLLVQDSEVSIIDTDVSGATNVAIDISGASRVNVMASDIHNNPGAALAVRSGATARVTHNVFMKNASSPRTAAPIILEERTDLSFAGNIFHDVPPAAFRSLSEPARVAVSRDNWFSDRRAPRAAPPRPRGSQP